MQLQPAPTSPKSRPAQSADSRFDRPPRWPWGRLCGLILLVSLVVMIGAGAGLAWMIRSYPDLEWLRPWKLTSTTVIERPLEEVTKVTRPIRTVEQTDLIVLANETSLITPDRVIGVGLPLSSNGWLVTLRAGLPDQGTLKIVNADGLAQTVERRINDPAGVFTYLKTTELRESPASFTPLSDAVFGQRLWLGQRAANLEMAVETRLAKRLGPVWEPSDQLNLAWTVTAGGANLSGVPLMDDRGYVLGLVDPDGRVWPTSGIEPILKPLLQTGGFERPAFGWLALELERAIQTAASADQARGWQIGTDSDQPALTPQGPAQRAGLQSGDVITSLDGDPVSGPVWSWLQRFRPGQSVPVTYQRAGVQRETTLQVESLRP